MEIVRMEDKWQEIVKICTADKKNKIFNIDVQEIVMKVEAERVIANGDWWVTWKKVDPWMIWGSWKGGGRERWFAFMMEADITWFKNRGPMTWWDQFETFRWNV